jgi:hypothetical protein
MNNVSHEAISSLQLDYMLPFLMTYFVSLQVPHTTFLLTHVCFLFYHVASNITLRRLRHSIADLPEKVRWMTEAAWILALAYFIAYLETIAISNVCDNKTFVPLLLSRSFILQSWSVSGLRLDKLRVVLPKLFDI